MSDEEFAGYADEDAVPETPEIPVSVSGGLWILGDHRLYCDDATQMEAIEKVMGGGLADMVSKRLFFGLCAGIRRDPHFRLLS
jgi:hypothetical protein